MYMCTEASEKDHLRAIVTAKQSYVKVVPTYLPTVCLSIYLSISIRSVVLTI